jgi:hypothetical protein
LNAPAAGKQPFEMFSLAKYALEKMAIRPLTSFVRAKALSLSPAAENLLQGRLQF